MKYERNFNRAALEKIQKARLDLGERKNHDYGGVADAIAIAGPHGVAVRMLDKVLRLMSLTQPGFKAQVTEEAIRDTALDLGNYSDYLVSLLDGTWGRPDLNKIQNGLDFAGPDEQ